MRKSLTSWPWAVWARRTMGRKPASETVIDTDETTGRMGCSSSASCAATHDTSYVRAERDGWRYASGIGWLCPAHVGEGTTFHSMGIPPALDPLRTTFPRFVRADDIERGPDDFPMRPIAPAPPV